MTKHRARRTTVCGIEFDSGAEASHYLYLLSRQQAGEISDLTLQPRFLLLEGFTTLQGEKIRPTHYTADFQYCEAGRVVVVDVKGDKAMDSRDFVLRKKLFQRRYPEADFRVVR